jgi:uncharacterized protein
LVLVGVAALVAGVIQRVTGLAFVLVLLGPIVLVHGPIEGVTLAVLLAVIASGLALPSAWRDVDWKPTVWLLAAGVISAPFGVLITRLLPETALLFMIAGMAVIALLAHRLRVTQFAALRGRPGTIIAGATAGFMHSSSGLSGPALAAYAVAERWEQQRFAASAQVVLLGYGVISVLLRGLPSSSPWEIVLLGVCTALGVGIGARLVRVIPSALARTAMLCCAWAGALVVLVRAIVAVTT